MYPEIQKIYNRYSEIKFSHRFHLIFEGCEKSLNLVKNLFGVMKKFSNF